MLRLVCVLVFLAFDSVPAFARMGETLEQCELRYGKSTKRLDTDLPNHVGAEFKKNDLRINAYFDLATSRCVYIEYWGVGGDQAEALVELNKEGSTWGAPKVSEVNAPGISDVATTWFREDGAAATSSAFLKHLTIRTMAVQQLQESQAEERRKRKRDRSLQGF